SDLHNLSHQLHPSSLHAIGLVSALRGFCREFAAHHQVDVQFINHDAAQEIPQEVSLCVFRVVQEALRNVVKHSGAKAAIVNLQGDEGKLKLSISDSGTGFDPDSAKQNSGLGLISMQERLRLIGGELWIQAAPSFGTHLYVEVPIRVVTSQASS